MLSVQSGNCRGGLRFGALAGLFYAVQQISSIARAERGLPDTVAGGTAAGAVFGATGVSLCSIFKSQHFDQARLQMPEITSLHWPWSKGCFWMGFHQLRHSHQPW